MAASIPPPGANCPQALNLTNNQPGNYSDVETALTAAEASATAVYDISMIAVSLLLAEVPALPLLPFISLGYAIYELVNIFGGGKPKFQDTNNVIAAYKQSKYWPLHALAADLQIAANNGAPISDSNPAVQAQFSAWKLGTIQSIQQLAGWPAGQQSPGFWQLQRLINQSWVASGGSQQDVAHVVNAMDRYAEILACLKAQIKTQPPPAPPPTLPPGVVPGVGPNDILVTADGDELNDLQRTLIWQNSLIYQQLLLMGQALSKPTDDTCCQNVVLSITNVVSQLATIGAALAFPKPTPVTLDFTPLTDAVSNLITAVGAYPPALQACCTAINSGLGGIKDAITNAPGADTKGIVDAINHFAKIVDVKPATVQYLVDQGYLDPQLAQVVTSADFGDWLVGALRTWGWTAYQWVLKTVGAGSAGAKPVLAALSGSIAEVVATGVSGALSAGAAPMYPEIKGVIDGVVRQLQPTGLPDIGNVKVDPDLLLAKTLAPILIINGIALLADYFGWEVSEQLKEYVTIASEFVGLQEVRELKVGQMMRFGPMREAELRAKGTYRQEIAGLGTMAGWVARGLYSGARYQGLAPLTGTPPEQVDPTLAAAYRGLNARQMLRLIETNLFSQAEISDELTFSGMRPVSQTRMEHAAPYLATNTERRSLISTLEKAYIQGLLDDPGLTGNVDSSENNVDRDNLILQRVKWEVLIQETKDLESEYTTLYLGGVIDDPTFRGYLGGLGLQPWKVNTVAAKAEARAAATLQRKTIAAAVALQRATASEERKAAMHNFTAGNIDAAALGIALVATGLTPTQAIAWSDLAVLQKAGGLHWKYGLQLSPAQATLLGERVAALTDQRKRLQISDAQYVSDLQALAIPPRYINALQAAADALITPKKSAFPIPVQTN